MKGKQSTLSFGGKPLSTPGSKQPTLAAMFSAKKEVAAPDQSKATDKEIEKVADSKKRTEPTASPVRPAMND
jgi:hypothetical protein